MKRFFALLALGLFATSGHAAIVYDNGGPNGVDGNEATAWLQAEDFSIVSGATITSAEVFLAGSNGISNWNPQTLTYYFFADLAGSPGALIASGNATGLTVTSTGNSWSGGGDTYSVLFSLGSSFVATAGTTYWFGIHAAQDFSTRDDIYWVTTDPTSGNGYESAGGTLNNWFANEYEHAFNLRSADTAPVPIPAAAWLLLSGLAGLGYVGRRKVAA